MKLSPLSLVLVVAAALAGCGESATLPLAAGTGPRPQLPPPHKTLLPTVHIAPAKGWPAGDKPVAAPGLVVTAYGTGLDHPRWLTVLPNGDVLVAETNAPPKPEDGKGIKGWMMKQLMKRAGAGTPSANRITLLRGVDAGGSAASRTVFLENLRSPFGMALVGNTFYVANTDGVVRFPYLDVRLLEYTCRLQERQKVRGLKKRYLFKRAMAKILPEKILRKKKQGFGLPIAVWLRTDEAFKATVRDTLFDQRARQRGFWDAPFVERLMAEHERGAWDHADSIWRLFVMERWLRRYVDAA